MILYFRSGHFDVKSKGLEQIQNKQLRFLIRKYYDDEVSHMIKSIGDIEITFNRDWMPILITEARANIVLNLN